LPSLLLAHPATGLGIPLTFVAATVQQRRLAVHLPYLSHNALYHVIQGLALLMIFTGRGLAERGAYPAVPCLAP